MQKNKTIWLVIEIYFYFLLFYLIPNFIYSLKERSLENSSSTIARITLIAEIDPNTINQIEEEARQQRLQQLREQQQKLRESQRQRYEQQQQEYQDMRTQQQEKYQDMRIQQQERDRDMRIQQQERDRDMRIQEQERIRQREELIRLR